tara:strand:+ start:221 stop:961 length:741 start_codon:yes stop_codon:yes gene_type:complete
MSGGMGGGEEGIDPPTTTKGDLSGFDTTFDRVPIGANTQVLTADSTEALGLKWAASSGAPLASPVFTGQVTIPDTVDGVGAGKLELIESYIAPATASTKTFTFSAKDMINDYSELTLIGAMKSSGALDLELNIDSVVASHDYNYIMNDSTTLSGVQVNSGSEYKIMPTAIIDGAREMNFTVNIKYYDNINYWIIEWVAGSANEGCLTGVGASPDGSNTHNLTQLTVSTSTSTWAIVSHMTLYGVRK